MAYGLRMSRLGASEECYIAQNVHLCPNSNLAKSSPNVKLTGPPSPSPRYLGKPIISSHLGSLLYEYTRKSYCTSLHQSSCAVLRDASRVGMGMSMQHRGTGDSRSSEQRAAPQRRPPPQRVHAPCRLPSMANRAAELSTRSAALQVRARNECVRVRAESLLLLPLPPQGLPCRGEVSSLFTK